MSASCNKATGKFIDEFVKIVDIDCLKVEREYNGNEVSSDVITPRRTSIAVDKKLDSGL